MAMNERKTKTRTRAKVVGAILKDPLADQRTIAKSAGVSKTTVHRLSKDIDQERPKSKAIDEIIMKDVEIVNIAQDIIMERLLNKPHAEKTRDIISAADTSAKRYSLFKGSITDEDGGLKDTTKMTLDELKQLAFNLK